MPNEIDEAPRREISTIAFPYMDLGDAIAMARTMLDRGGVPMDRDQLAAALGQVPNSGAFNNKLSTTRQFGLVEIANGRYQLTGLGFEILDPQRERAAKAQAFLNVELYRRTYDEFKGRSLPPKPLGLENAFVNFGVAQKQKDKARQAFERSARLAGFFPTPAEDRLVQPIVGPAPVSAPEPAPEPVVASSPGSRILIPHPAGAPSFMQWLLDELPETKSEWSLEDQANWLQAVAQAFRVVYRSGADGRINVLVVNG